MSSTIVLISSDIITKSQLLDFIFRSGGRETQDDGLFGLISRGGGHLWIGLSADELHTAFMDEGEPYVAALTRLLGGPPRSQVTVEISRDEGSTALAIEFALAFSERWPAVVDNLNGQPQSRYLLTHSDLLRCRAASGDVKYFASASPNYTPALPEPPRDLVGLYQDVLGYIVSPAELAYWQSQLASGASTLHDVRNAIARSSEAMTQINRVYQDALGRAASAAEMTASQTALADGASLNVLRALLTVASGFVSGRATFGSKSSHG